MYEVVALLAGAGVGFGLRNVTTGRAVAIAAIAAIVIGFVVSGLAGELEISAGFLLFDAGQAFLAAIAARVLARAHERRQAPSG